MTTHAHDELLITHDRANEAAHRFIRHYFRNEGKKPEIQIPARPYEDDDLVLGAYIKQQRIREAALTKQLEVALEMLAKLSNAVDQDYITLDSSALLALMEARNAIEQIKGGKV